MQYIKPVIQALQVLSALSPSPKPRFEIVSFIALHPNTIACFSKTIVLRFAINKHPIGVRRAHTTHAVARCRSVNP
ncbi:MAG: hypothetical protein Q4F84_11240, partial [Fibrobacter sp.]|nr:hypothetical protein [Fibrobacter sp.]